MKIGFLLPSVFAVGNPANGVRAQARFQAEALERAGHEVVRLSPWDSAKAGDLDVLQFFQGGFSVHNIEAVSKGTYRILAFAPIVDSNQPNSTYRIASAIGNCSSRFYTVPGVIRRQCLSSDLVICRSEHEQDRIVSGLGVPIERTELVLNGVNAIGPVDTIEVREKYNLPGEFVLHVSAYSQERKNVLRMVRALLPTTYPIVIAGPAKPGRVLDELHRYADHYDNLRLLDYLDARELAAMYAACKVFCLPSLHEGTGLVALEAAAYGARIVITKNGGPPDYFGTMAKYVDPYEEADIRNQVMAAWQEPSTDDLSNHVVDNLSWDRSADVLLSAYEHRLSNR